MRNPNDPAGGKENDFLNAHDQLLAGLNSPKFASLNISAADKATIAEDNAALHQAKTAADNAKALARSTNQTKASIIKRSDKNYRTIRGRIMVSPGYSVGSGVALGLEHTTGVAPGTTSMTGPRRGQDQVHQGQGRGGGLVLQARRRRGFCAHYARAAFPVH